MSVAWAGLKAMSGPFLKERVTTDAIMLRVFYALLPIVGFATWLFGISALLLTATTAAACVLTEYVLGRISKTPTTIGDYHALVTGVLLALTLPAGFPLYMAFIAGVIAIAIGKTLFGGLGSYVVNPVVVGRLFLMAVFPWALAGTVVPPGVPNRFVTPIPSTLAVPFASTPSVTAYANTVSPEGWTHAPASALAQLLGVVPGNLGETSVLLILACGAFLAARSFLKWRITVAVLVGALITALAFGLAVPGAYPSVLATLLGGGIVLGAVFIATDPVSSPATRGGMYLYGALIGVVTVVLGYTVSLPHPIVYAILLGNLLAPVVEAMTQPRPYGYRKPPKKL